MLSLEIRNFFLALLCYFPTFYTTCHHQLSVFKDLRNIFSLCSHFDQEFNQWCFIFSTLKESSPLSNQLSTDNIFVMHCKVCGSIMSFCSLDTVVLVYIKDDVNTRTMVTLSYSACKDWWCHLSKGFMFSFNLLNQSVLLKAVVYLQQKMFLFEGPLPMLPYCFFLGWPSGVASDQGRGPRGWRSTSLIHRPFCVWAISIICPKSLLSALSIMSLPLLVIFIFFLCGIIESLKFMLWESVIKLGLGWICLKSFFFEFLICFHSNFIHSQQIWVGSPFLWRNV